MDMLPRLVELLITPPGAVVLLLCITFLVYIKSYWAGAVMLAFSVTVLIAASLPLTAHVLMNGLQTYAKPLELVLDETSPRKNTLYLPRGAEKEPPQAIVVLGYGRYTAAPEYDGEDTAKPLGLERLRYAAWLQRKTGLPILVSGGRVHNERTAEADFMKQILTEDFRASVRWTEDQSHNTRENAERSAAILAEGKVRHVYLVTQAWHMRRAARHFESFGVRVTPAPVGFHTLDTGEGSLIGYLPTASGMQQVALALHERLGLLWLDWQQPSAEPGTPATKPAK